MRKPFPTVAMDIALRHRGWYVENGAFVGIVNNWTFMVGEENGIYQGIAGHEVEQSQHPKSVEKAILHSASEHSSRHCRVCS